MRRKDREVSDIQEIVTIIKKCDCCRVALFDNEFPYIVPMNFGIEFENNKIVLYFHCASEGKKLELISKNPNISFEMDCCHKLITGDKACDYTMEYESVIGNGKAQVVTTGKIEALNSIMRRFSDDEIFNYDENYLKAVTIFRIDVIDITGKRLKVK